MPVYTGTRLDRLQSLQRRTKHELASALRRGQAHEAARLTELDTKLTAAIWEAQPKVSKSLRAEPVVERIASLGVTAKCVRARALAEGLTKAQRGRLSMALVEAYAAAHPTNSKEALSA